LIRPFVDKENIFSDNPFVELKDFLAVLQKHLKASLLLSFLVAIAVFIISFYIPVKYKASATLYVKREAELGSPGYFTYEGFYAIQTAEKYTETVIGFLKSIDVRSAALKSVNPSFAYKDLVKLDDYVTVKRSGPQLVLVSVVGRDRDFTEKLWDSLVETTVKKSEELNKSADERLGIDLVEKKPVVVKLEPNPPLFALAGFFLSLFISVFYLSFKNYLKGGA